MSDVQRWAVKGFAMRDMVSDEPMEVDDIGPYVTYADHLAALAQAIEHRDALHATSNGMAYEQGRRDALAAARRVLTDDWYAVLESEVVGPHETAAIKGEQP